MKKVMFILTLLPVFLSAQNLIQNPSFETWVNDTFPTGWIRGTSGFGIYKDSGTVHSGSFSGYIHLLSTTTQRIEQYIDVSPLITYNCTLYVYHKDIHSRLRIYIRWYDSTGTYISYSSSGYSNPDSVNRWQMLTLDAQAPANADTAHFEIRLYDVAWGDSIDSSMCYIDDAFMGLPSNVPPAIGAFERDPLIPRPGVAQCISAVITDDGSITWDTLYYSTDQTTYTGVLHDSISGTRYFYTIPSQTEGTGVYYFIKASDNGGAISVSDTMVYRVYPPATDTLKNKGFELWSGDSTPDYWTVEYQNRVAVSRSTFAHTGSYSAKLDRISPENNGVYQKIKVDPFDTLVISAYLYDNDVDVRARLWCTWYLWDGSYSNNFDGYTVDSTDWQMLSDTIIAPDMADTLSIRIRVYTEGGDSLGVVYLDGVYASAYGVEEPSIKIEKRNTLLMGSFVSLTIPNPGTHKFKILDIAGRVVKEMLVKTSKKNENIKIDTGKLKRGVYFIMGCGRIYRGVKIN